MKHLIDFKTFETKQNNNIGYTSNKYDKKYDFVLNHNGVVEKKTGTISQMGIIGEDENMYPAAFVLKEKAYRMGSFDIKKFMNSVETLTEQENGNLVITKKGKVLKKTVKITNEGIEDKKGKKYALAVDENGRLWYAINDIDSFFITLDSNLNQNSFVDSGNSDRAWVGGNIEGSLNTNPSGDTHTRNQGAVV